MAGYHGGARLRPLLARADQQLLTADSKAGAVGRRKRGPLAASRFSRKLAMYLAFWLFIFIGLYYVVRSAHVWGIEEPTKILVAAAIVCSAGFAHFTVLQPFIGTADGLTRFRSIIFTLMFVAVIMAIFFGLYDLSLAFGQHLFRDIKVFMAGHLPSRTMSGVEFILKFHTVAFVVVFLILDILIALSANREESRDHFRKIAVFIDVPMTLGIIYTAVVGTTLVAQGPEFEAGAIALQLFAANIQLVLFELTNYFGGVEGEGPPPTAA